MQTYTLAVDARGLNQSGIGRYLREILVRLLGDERLASVRLAGDPARLHDFVAGRSWAPKVEVVPFAYPFYSPVAHARWGLLERSGRLKADVSFFPHYDVPVSTRAARAVVVVHDLIHFRLPSLFPASRRLAAAAVLRRAVGRSRRIIVSSEATRADLVERHPEVASRIVLLPHGVRSDFASGRQSPTVGGRPIEAWRPYLLCVGNRKPHKNLATAVEEFAGVHARRPDLRLVIVGPSFGDGSVRSRARARGVDEAVVEIDEVRDDELLGLYAHAEALLFPSLYEGFGLPLLEAMHFGVPVVASNRGSIPEVVGSAGLIADPQIPGAMAAAVLRLMDEAELRRRLADAGRKRASEFSWDRSAARTADLLAGMADIRHQEPITTTA